MFMRKFLWFKKLNQWGGGGGGGITKKSMEKVPQGSLA